MSPQERSSAPLLIGHRGAKGLARENSLAAFREAIRLGVDVVELDVHQTVDGQLVVIHDALLDRTTSGSGAVGLHSFAEVKRARLRGSKERVPSLEGALRLLAPTDVGLHIELKNDHVGEPYEGMAANVLDAVRTFEINDRVALTSFVPDVLDEARRANCDVPLLASVNRSSAAMLGGLSKAIDRLRQISNCALSIEKSLLQSALTASFPALRVSEVGIWVVNNEEELEHWIGMGVRHITTDRPDVALKVRERVGRFR